jgi:fatty-acid desaturase
MNRKKGFLYSHIGWRCLNIPKNKDVTVKDLEADVLVNLQHKLYLIIAILTGLVFPAWLGFYLSKGDVTGYIVCFLCSSLHSLKNENTLITLNFVFDFNEITPQI